MHVRHRILQYNIAEANRNAIEQSITDRNLNTKRGEKIKNYDDFYLRPQTPGEHVTRSRGTSLDRLDIFYYLY